MFFKLTLKDGTPMRVNMNKVEGYYPIESEGVKTTVNFNNDSYLVQETAFQIDEAFADTKHPLRVPTGW